LSTRSALGEPPAIVENSHQPTRIVSLTPSVTETLFALGMGARVVGVSQYCDYPPEATRLPRVGSFLAPVVEAVTALEPDLILTSPSPGNQEPVAALARAGLRVVPVPEGSESVAAVLQSIRAVAMAVGATDAAAPLIAGIENAIADAETKARGRPRPSVAIVVGFEPLVLAGPDSYLGDLVARVGGDDVSRRVGGKWPRVGLELLVAAAPEVIIDLTMGYERSTDTHRWDRFADIPAVRSGRVVFDASQVFLRPGPRLGEQARRLSRFLHPEAWPRES
jgi:iron complex transport system substrate-binding protein